jgi:hypothetical protein
MCFYNETFGNDQYAEITLSAVGAFHEIGALVRGSSNNGYCLNIASGNWYLGRIVSGSWTQIATGAKAFSAGEVIRLEVSGTTLKMYQDDVQFGGDQTDSNISTGAPGVSGRGWDGGTSATSWEGGEL